MRNIKIDFFLVVPVVLLLILGITIIRSVAPALVQYQALFVLLAIVAYFLFSSFDHEILFNLAFPLFIFSLLFLVTPYLFGFSSRGAVRWIPIGQFSLQPSEIVKPFLLICYSVIATKISRKKLLWQLIAFLIPAALIFLQPDLGTTLVLGIAWWAIIVSEMPPKTLFISLLLIALTLPLSAFVLKPYQLQRLTTFVNPYADPLGQGYHVIQSLIAVGSGGWLGRGLGHGTQSQLRFLPEHHTDFVFASLSEELGFIGVAIVILLYLILYYRIYRISQQASNRPAAIFSLSVLAMLSFQTFVNIGMNMGIAPITGITLPFLSYGGSSLLSLGIIFGVLNSISATGGKSWFKRV